MARQGIEPWSTDYETAALPLSYRATGLRVDTILRELGEVLSLRGSFGVVPRFQCRSNLFRLNLDRALPFRNQAICQGSLGTKSWNGTRTDLPRRVKSNDSN